MKTPEEIKHTLERCKSRAGCKECPYFSETECFDAMHPDALEYIKRLECELEVMKAYMRYIAVELPSACRYCKHNEAGKVCEQECYGQGLEHFAFEWKGLLEGVFEKKEEA